MSNSLSDRARAIVVESLPLIEQHRAALDDAFDQHMARHGPDDSAERSKVASAAVMEMLLDHARSLAGRGPANGIVETARNHRALALGAEHYSTFGDGLKPILKDVLRSKATSPVLAAWTDAYWAIVRLLFRQETRLAA
jgi:nitric oxide dioxygenase